MQKALIYCRVSSQKQVNHGHGLESQESRCRQYAKSKKYQVVRIFQDQAVSGGLFERKAMRELIDFLQKHPEESFVVVFDDLKRFARDIMVHLRLKSELLSYGAKLECLNFQFEDSPEGRFIELIIAGQGQLEREQNGRQVKQKMKARMQAGYWCLQAPIGYTFAKNDTQGKVLSPIEGQADLVKQALEGFAYGRFRSQKQVADFLNKHDFRGKKIYRSFIRRLLTTSLYAGYYQYQKWGIDWIKAKHEPIISLATYQIIQEKLLDKKRIQSPTKNEDFPLRGLIYCSDCGKRLTASKVKGRNKYYPLYSCHNKHCTAKPKNIQKQVLESDYIALLKSYQSTQKAIDYFKSLILEQIELQTQESSKFYDNLQAKQKQLEKQKNTILDRLASTENSEVIEAYEAKLVQIQKQIAKIKQEKEHPININTIDVGTALKMIVPLLKNPDQYWTKWNAEKKQALHELLFLSDLQYNQKKGFRTAQKSLLFCLKGQSKTSKFHLVQYVEQHWNQIIQQILSLKQLITSQ